MALDEVTANYAGRMLEDGALLDRFINQNSGTKPSLIRRFLDWLRSVKDRLTGKQKANAPEAEAKLMAALEAGSRRAAELTEEQNAAAAEADGVARYSQGHDPETASVKEQISNSQEILANMAAVETVKVPEHFAAKSDAVRWGIELLAKTGYAVERQGYGKIVFSPKDINHAMNYAGTDAEMAAIAALPGVLKRGIEIGRHNDHKGRKKTTVTFAAPVVLNGTRGNMAVVVNQNGDHYYAHRIVMPDGSAFVFATEKSDVAQEPSRGVAVSSSLADTTSATSGDSISQGEENVKGKSSQETETRHSIKGSERVGELTEEDIATIQSIGRKSVNELTSEELQKVESFARRYWQEMGEKSPFFRAWFGDWRANDQTAVTVVDATDAAAPFRAGKAVNADTGRTISWGDTLKGETLTHGGTTEQAALGQIRQIVENAVLLDTETSSRTSKNKLPGTAFMHSFYALVKNGEGTSLYKLFAEEAISAKDGEPFTRAYELKGIKEVVSAAKGVLSQTGGLTQAASTTEYSVADLFYFVKQYDQNFHPKDVSKVVDDEGKPLVVYHATWSEPFTVFDRGRLGENTEDNGAEPQFVETAKVGFWFNTQNLSEPINRAGDRAEAVYLNITNPYQLDSLDALAEEVERSGGGEAFAAWLEEEGYDGLEVDDEEFGGTSYVALRPEQIKSATDNTGAFDRENPDIRYSIKGSERVGELRELEEENKRLQEQADYWYKQAHLTPGGKAVDTGPVRTEAKRLLNMLGTKTITLKETETKLKGVFDFLATGRDGDNELSYAALREKAEDLARELVTNAVRVDDSIARQYADLRAHVKSTQIILSEEDAADIPDYNDWRLQQSGRLTIRRAKAGERARAARRRSAPAGDRKAGG